MNTSVQQPVAIACLFTWIGFVCAISFLEAWLKFRAPGVTLPIGLGIGRLVFGALNKVEWVFAAVVCISTVMHGKPFMTLPNMCLTAVVMILVMQTVWLLPALDVRAELHMQGKPVPHSYLHFWFVGAEVVKVITLFITAILLLKKS